MASKEELSDQLALSTKLAAVVEKMAAAAERAEQAYQGQMAAVQGLVDVFARINTADLAGGIEKLTAEMKAMSDQMAGTGKVTEGTFKKLAKGADDAGKKIGDKLPKSVLIATGAISGLAQGVRNVVALGKGLVGFTASFVTGLSSIAASIIAIPFKMFEGLVDLAAKGGSGMSELAQAIEDLRKQFGQLAGPTSKAVIENSKALKGFSDTGLSAYRVFGNMAERLNYMRELMTELGGAVKLLDKEFTDNGGAILAYTKGLGLSNEALKAVVQTSASMGKKSSTTLKDMTKYSYELGDAFGIDAKIISREMGDAMKDMGHFGTTSVKSLAESVTFAHRFGLELKDISGTLDKYLSFDDAADSAAKLNQAFGANIDSLALMKASAEGDAGKSLEILRKSFKAAGVDATKFTAVDRKLIAQNTGLSDSAIQAAFSMKNQGISLKDVQKKGAEAEKKTLTQAEAMQKLAGAIERMVKSGELTGGFWKMFLGGVLSGIQSSKEFVGVMFKIRQALLQVRMVGVQLGRDLVKIVPGLADIGKGLNEFFEPKKFRMMFQKISDTVRAFFDPKSKAQGSIPMLVEGLHKSIVDMFTVEGSAGKKVLDGFKKFFLMASKAAGDGIKWMSDEVAKGIRVVIDLLTGKRKLSLGGASAAAGGALGFMQQVMGPIAEGIKHAWEVLKGPVHDLVLQLGHMLKKFLTSKEFIGLIKPALPLLVAALFGPAVGRGILGSLSGTIIKSVLSGGAKAIFKRTALTIGRSVAGGAAEGGGAAGGLASVAGPAALVAAAAAIGSGVDKYTDQITGTLDRSSARIAAGATGLIDALTLGLLPKGLDVEIANTLAKASDMLFAGISSVFGKGFGESIKKQLGNAFAVLGSIWSVLKNLFTGDQKSINDSFKELGLSLLRFLVGSVNFVLIQLPLLLGQLGTKLMSMIMSVVVSLVGVMASALAGGIDKVFGTHLADKVVAATDSIQKVMQSSSTALTKQLGDVGTAFSQASGEIQDKYLTSQAEKDKELARRAQAAAEGGSGSIADAAKTASEDTKSSVASIGESIAAVKDVKKQLDDKDFDLAGSIRYVQDKVAGVDFNFISDAQASAIAKSSDNLRNVSGSFDLIKATVDRFGEISKALGALTNVNLGADLSKAFDRVKAALSSFSGAGDNFSAMTASVTKATASISDKGMGPALDAVQKMVKAVNDMNAALSDGDLNKIDIKAKLQNVATSMGLGGKASYTVNPGTGVAITVNMTVTMDAGAVEKAIIYSKRSIIADRLNFATSQPTATAPDKLTPAGAAQFPLTPQSKT